MSELDRSIVRPGSTHRYLQRTATAKPDKAKPIAVVPFEMLPTNHMLVEARINGKGPYHLIFDLGAPVTLLSNRVSEATGVVKASCATIVLVWHAR